ncbi:MAG: 3-keto-disaccharide hydrolase [Lentimonas sp.]
MKATVSLLGLFVLPLLAIGEPGFHQYKHPGHDWSQLIPGSKWRVHDVSRPTPQRVIPGSYNEQGVEQAPSDAEILFDGSSLDKFKESNWSVKDGYILSSWGGLISKKAYGDFQMHLEFRSPDPSVVDKNSKMGNSGIYIMGRYELQIFDSYSCEIYADGSAGALYGQTPPLVNVSRKPGEWQTFDIYFTAPVFDGDELVSPARMTVLHNGVFVQIDTELTGPTNHNKPAFYEAHSPRLPFFIQGGKCPVEFRNIWIRDLGK